MSGFEQSLTPLVLHMAQVCLRHSSACRCARNRMAHMTAIVRRQSWRDPSTKELDWILQAADDMQQWASH